MYKYYTPSKKLITTLPKFFHKCENRQNETRFDLGRVFEMHIAQKNFELHHSQLHVGLIAITTLMRYLELHLEKSDSKMYLGVVFPKKIENQRSLLINASHDHETRCV